MSATIDRTTTRPKKVLIVVANPTVSTTTGWPVGFWASEVTHPWYELSCAGEAAGTDEPEACDAA